jgi:hypothetical protein
MTHIQRVKVHSDVNLPVSNERDHSEDLGTDVKVILEWILGTLDGKLWTGCIWLRIGTSGGLVYTIMNLWVPQKVGNFLTSFSRKTLLYGVSSLVSVFVC